MGKRINKFLIFAVVLLYQLSASGIASAGSFNLFASLDTGVDYLVSPIISDTRSNSFEKIFSWSNRSRENITSTQLILTKDPEPEYIVIGTYTVGATGYSSTPDQTDDTPCIAASGYNVCTGGKNAIAANFSINGQRAPFGTLVRIPDLYGDKIFVIEDRMNSRYTNNIDIWFLERSSALQFGRQKLTIEVVVKS